MSRFPSSAVFLSLPGADLLPTLNFCFSLANSPCARSGAGRATVGLPTHRRLASAAGPSHCRLPVGTCEQITEHFVALRRTGPHRRAFYLQSGRNGSSASSLPAKLHHWFSALAFKRLSCCDSCGFS